LQKKQKPHGGFKIFLANMVSVSRGGVQSGRLLTYDPSKNIPPDTQCHSVHSPILVCVQEGDIVGAKELLYSGKSSLNDVDPYGLGLLYVCILGHLRRTAIEIESTDLKSASMRHTIVRRLTDRLLPWRLAQHCSIWALMSIGKMK
jgi:hypothetical protein